MRNPYNHVDMRVRDMDSALPFYEAFLHGLGFVGPELVPEADGRVWRNFRFRHGPIPSQFFGLIEAPDHAPNENCVAFHVPTRQRVDELADIASAAGGDVDPPSTVPEYGDAYYALFLRDPSGNRLEICCMVESGEHADRADVVSAVAECEVPEGYAIRAWRRHDHESILRLGSRQGADAAPHGPDRMLRAWAGSWPALVGTGPSGLVACLRAISDYETRTEVLDLIVEPGHEALRSALLQVCRKLTPGAEVTTRGQ